MLSLFRNHFEPSLTSALAFWLVPHYITMCNILESDSITSTSKCNLSNCAQSSISHFRPSQGPVHQSCMKTPVSISECQTFLLAFMSTTLSAYKYLINDISQTWETWECPYPPGKGQIRHRGETILMHSSKITSSQIYPVLNVKHTT